MEAVLVSCGSSSDVPGNGTVIWVKVLAGFASNGIVRTVNALKRVHEELKVMTEAQRTVLFCS